MQTHKKVKTTLLGANISYLHGFVAKIANGIFAFISFVRHEGIGGLGRKIIP